MEWRDDDDLPVDFRRLSVKLQAWNKATFGNIFQRKKRNELRLRGVQRALARRAHDHLIRLERELNEERKLILLQEELLWRQKSRNDWLKARDGNTSFFHTSTLIRRKRKRIESLQNTEGIWLENKEDR